MFAVTENPKHFFAVAPQSDSTDEVVRKLVGPLTTTDPPKAHYTCDCRMFMPGGLLMGDDDPGDETLETADRRTLARRRPHAEPPSGETVQRGG